MTLKKFWQRFFPPSEVHFEDGSSIKWYNIEAILYTERDGHAIEIMWFWDGKTSKSRILPLYTIKNWDPPHQSEVLSSAKKDEIINKLLKYCEARRAQ